MPQEPFTKSRIITIVSPKGNILKMEASSQNAAEEFIAELEKLYPIQRVGENEPAFETEGRVFKVYVNAGYIEEPCRCGRILCGKTLTIPSYLLSKYI